MLSCGNSLTPAQIGGRRDHRAPLGIGASGRKTDPGQSAAEAGTPLLCVLECGSVEECGRFLECGVAKCGLSYSVAQVGWHAPSSGSKVSEI